MPRAVASLGAAALLAGGRSWASKPTTKHPQQHNGKFRISSSSFHRPRRADNLCPIPDCSSPAHARDRATSAVNGLSTALDRWHHLSTLAQACKSSSLKALIKFMREPGMISLPECRHDWRRPRRKVGSPIDLATVLQCSLAMGISLVRTFMSDFITRVFKPTYADFATSVYTGNTDGCVYPL
ncbi:hypothetical protein AURDEDRAFT_165756 [Auricularia subglabra TFB-10046 SS5]|nr:hypothetical protein AURDEDRAFT_165756 [Auricularia subglabra TFB-10046 SS5]